MIRMSTKLVYEYEHGGILDVFTVDEDNAYRIRVLPLKHGKIIEIAKMERDVKTTFTPVKVLHSTDWLFPFWRQGCEMIVPCKNFEEFYTVMNYM